MVHTGTRPKGKVNLKTLKIMYTNIDGLLSCMLEIKDYLREHRPDVLCLSETKLKEVQVCFKNEGYNIWRRDRKGKWGGGVLVLTKKDIYVDEVQYGEGMAEVIGITIKISKRVRRKIIVTYVPPKTNVWKMEEHREMHKEVLKCLEGLIRKGNKILLMGDFNCRDVNWKELEGKEIAGTWSEKLLQLIMVNTMEQWVDEFTRYRGDAEPSILDLIFTKKPESKPNLRYLSPMGKSDHVVIEMEINETEREAWKEDYKNGRLNHAKSKFEELKKYFGDINWKQIMEGKTVQEKYETFLNKYKEGVQKYVPVYKVKKGKHCWYNARCTEAKRKKDSAWKKLKKQRNEYSKNLYKEKRNEYVRIRREEEIKFEKDVVIILNSSTGMLMVK